jgi:cytochrome oxidase Cu insertion factor (SCO1/SenC/PrrC family)
MGGRRAGGRPAFDGRAGLGRALAGLVLGVWLVGPAGAAPPLPRLGSAPNFALTTQLNDRIWLAHLRERLVVLTFTCATCTACPALLPALREAARGVGEAAGRRVFFAVVTVDPAHDGAAELRRFAREQGLDASAWLLLTGKPAEIDLVTRWYGVGVRRPDGHPSHDCLAVLIDGAGVIRGRYGPSDLGRLPGDLATLLAE